LRGDQLSADTSAWCLPQSLRASRVLDATRGRGRGERGRREM